MKNINSELLEKFIGLAGKRLSGDWIILGGTVLPLLGIDHRTTVDIDLARAEKSGDDQSLELMQIAEDIGLPPEAVNPAASFFLHKISDWRENLVLVSKGSKAKIYRPNGTLFLLLKISRLSESDLADCLEMLKYCKKNKEAIDLSRLQKALTVEIQKCESSDPEKVKRLKSLRQQTKTN